MSAKRLQLLPLLLVAVFAMGLVGCGTQVPSGPRGVFYYKFGDGTEFGTVYPEGFTWHLPWNKMFVYKVQLQENKESLTILSSDGATIRMEVSVLYRPIWEKLDSLQVTIGPSYYQVSVAPTIRGIARTVAGNYTPEEIYATKRQEVAERLIASLKEAMSDKFIEIENVVIRDVLIPAKISEAIDFKLTAEQESEKMKLPLRKRDWKRNEKGLRPRVLPTSRKS